MLEEKEVVIAADTVLPGVSAIGNGYDINGRYADPKSFVGGVLFDFGTQSYEVEIAGRTYRLPEAMTVQEDYGADYEQQLSESLDEFRQQLGTDVGVQGSYQLFSASLEVSFSMSDLQVSSITLASSRLVHSLWIIRLASTKKLREMLRPEVRSDLDDPSVSPMQIFKRYGAYFIGEAVIGGRLDYNSATRTHRADATLDIGQTAKASFDAKIGRIGFSETTDLTRRIAKFEEVSETRITAVGGSQTALAKIIAGDKPIAAYEEWAKSLQDYAMLTAFTPQSLRPIWALAATEDRQNELANAFPAYVESTKRPIKRIGTTLMWITDPAMKHDYTDAKSFAEDYLSVFHPAVDEGYSWVGQSAQRDHETVARQHTPVLKDPFRLGLLKEPNGWARLWWHHINGRYFSCWRAIPPLGYRALGDIFVVQPSKDKDDNGPTVPGDIVKDYACVHHTLCKPVGKLTEKIWTDFRTTAGQRITLWRFAGSDGEATVQANTFVGVPRWGDASGDDVAGLSGHIGCLREGVAADPATFDLELEQFPALKQWVRSSRQRTE